jgi:hypothetical protein
MSGRRSFWAVRAHARNAESSPGRLASRSPGRRRRDRRDVARAVRRGPRTGPRLGGAGPSHPVDLSRRAGSRSRAGARRRRHGRRLRLSGLLLVERARWRDLYDRRVLHRVSMAGARARLAAGPRAAGGQRTLAAPAGRSRARSLPVERRCPPALRAPGIRHQTQRHHAAARPFDSFHSLRAGPFDSFHSLRAGPFDSFHSLRAGPFDSFPSLRAGPFDSVHSLRAGPFDSFHSLRAGPFDSFHSLRAGPFDSFHSLRAGPFDSFHSLRAGPFDSLRSLRTGRLGRRTRLCNFLLRAVFVQ